MTISLPPEMAKQVERIQKKEHRTRSELLREAWRVYFESRYSVYSPTKSELAAIRRGQAEFARGEYVTLAQLHHDLVTAPDQRRKKQLAKLRNQEQIRIERALDALEADPFSGRH